MTVIICPRCRERTVVTNYTDDMVHRCSSGKAVLDEEDVLDLTPANWNLRAAANRQFGRVGHIENRANIDDLSERGKRTAIFTQEQHFEFIDLRGKRK